MLAKIISVIPALALAAGTMASASAIAQQGAYPAKPIVVIVPFPPGGTSDQEARRHTSLLMENTRWPVIIEYKLGAGATLGVSYVAKAAPDGYTILSGTSSFVAAPAVYKKISYDPMKDFSHIVLMSKRGSLFVVHSGLPVNSFSEYVKYVKANPGKINVGTSGAGSAPHLGAAYVHDLIDGDVAYVHYKGSSQMNIDLAAGRIQANIGILAVLPLVKAGKLKVLGVTSRTRSKLLPDVPTIAEQGVPSYEHVGWSGYVAPAGTPTPIINRLNSEFVKVAKSREIAEALALDNGDPIGSTPEEFRQFLTEEVARWQKTAQRAGIQLDE